MADREARVVRIVLAALLAIGTAVWALGREDHKQPTADLHADADYYYVYLPSLLHGDLDFADEYRETHNWYHLGATPTGRPGNVFGIGPAILDAPLFLIGHAIARASGARGDGFSSWEVRLFTWSSLAWSLGAVWVAYLLVRRRLGGGARALAGPVIAALAGPVVYYAVRQPGYAHPMATFFAAALVERWDASYDAPRTVRTWIVLGALLGAAALARPQLALWGVLLARAAIDDLRNAPRGGRARLVRGWLAGAAAAFVVFAPQLLAWRVLYGHFYVVPQGPGFMRWDDPCWSDTLFSSRNGLFPWSPALLVFAIALGASLRSHARLAGGLLGGFLLQAIANGAVWDWWAGGSFGGRRFDSAYIAFAFGAAALIAWIARAIPSAIARAAGARVRAIGAVAALAALVTLALVAANLALCGEYTVTSARITGGEPASGVIRAKVGGVHGRIAAWASSLSNLPSRAWFAWRHDTNLAAYDRLVGAHVLGDTYPGLNSYADQRTGSIPPPALDADGHAHAIVMLNRIGRVELAIPIDGEGQVTIEWNGRELAEQSIAPGAIVRIRTIDLRRGANDLVIDAPPGAKLGAISLEASNAY
jgi:hypothetical protein